MLLLLLFLLPPFPHVHSLLPVPCFFLTFLGFSVVAANSSCPTEKLEPGYENLKPYTFNFDSQERALRSVDFLKGRKPKSVGHKLENVLYCTGTTKQYLYSSLKIFFFLNFILLFLNYFLSFVCLRLNR